jgi:hypothetical protein
VGLSIRQSECRSTAGGLQRGHSTDYWLSRRAGIVLGVERPNGNMFEFCNSRYVSAGGR